MSTTHPDPVPLADDTLRRAVSLCSAAQFADALALVEPLVASDVHAPDVVALNVAATASLALGRLADAEARWRRCIAAQPDFPDAYNGLGILLQTQGRLADAEATYRQWLTLRPDDVHAHNNLGTVLHAMGRGAGAEAAWRRAIELQPDHAQAHGNLGVLLHEAGRFDEAEAAWRAAIALRPDHAKSHTGLGNALCALGRHDDAAAAYQRALSLNPRDADALNQLGSLLHAAGRLPEAELAFRLATGARADYAEAHLNLGAVLMALKRTSDAEASYRTALAHRPNYAQAHYNLGIALHALERLPEAEVAYRRAIVCQPDLVHAHNNLGCVLRAQDRIDEAIDAFRSTLAVNEELPEAHNNLAGVLRELGRADEAEAEYRRAIALRADYADAKFGLAVLLLAHGRFDEGWALYESRYEQPNFVHHRTRTLLQCPQWQGEPLAGKSVFVWQEDGLGDMLQFGRYFAGLKALGAAHIAFACVPTLRPLFARVAGVDAVLDHHEAAAQSSRYDCWTSLISVPFRLRTTLDTIPAPLRFVPEAARVERWRARLGAVGGRKRVGLVWKGNPRHHNDANRSVPSLAALAPLWRAPSVEFVSLQKGRGEDDARNPSPDQPLVALGHEIADFADTAAIVELLDLVICVDTSTAHLAASMGKPCWVMLPGHDVDWRWMRGRDDSPWYPDSMRLFWPRDGERWDALVERVADACVAWAHAQTQTESAS
ncbi:MAG TPA: tetratricopeptide repeat protein [Paraburkholderia sp.]|nr:tetratricopeptide repeat protein [Paraburkholderia sp.]